MHVFGVYIIYAICLLRFNKHFQRVFCVRRSFLISGLTPYDSRTERVGLSRDVAGLAVFEATVPRQVLAAESLTSLPVNCPLESAVSRIHASHSVGFYGINA